MQRKNRGPLTCKQVGWLIIVLLWGAGIGEAKEALTLASPSGDYRFTLSRDNCHATYQVVYRGKTVIAPSPLGFQMKDGTVLGSSVVKLEASAVSQNDTTWKPVYGERSTVRDRYTTQAFTLKSRTRRVQYAASLEAASQTFMLANRTYRSGFDSIATK